MFRDEFQRKLYASFTFTFNYAILSNLELKKKHLKKMDFCRYHVES